MRPLPATRQRGFPRGNSTPPPKSKESPSQTKSPFEPTASSGPRRNSPKRQKRQSPAAVTNQHKRAEPHRASPREENDKVRTASPRNHEAGPVNTIHHPWEGDQDIATADIPPTLRLPRESHVGSQALPARKPQPGAPMRARWYFGVGPVLPPCEGEPASATQRPPEKMTGRAPHRHGWTHKGVPIDYT